MYEGAAVAAAIAMSRPGLARSRSGIEDDAVPPV